MKLTIAEKHNKALDKKRDDWERVLKAIAFIKRNGGEVVNQHKKQRTFTLPRLPGIKILGAADCLINYGGFTRLHGEDETNLLVALMARSNIYNI